MLDRYYIKYAVAYIIGYLKKNNKTNLLPNNLLEKPLDLFDSEDFLSVLNLGEKLNVKLYHFKKTDRLLPRVNKTLGFLKSLYFESLLDVGSGRGVFLLPFLEEFSYIKVTSLDILDKRYEMLNNIALGGVENLTVYKKDICAGAILPKSVDVVTMLEVLEHIPNVKKAIENAVKIAKQYVVITVPSKEDDNPEHIHLLTKNILTQYFNDAGVKKLSFDGVNGHLFMVAKIEND